MFFDSQLKDTHSRICSTLGSDIAYSCYGKFLHSFVAGWEDDEKFKAYLAIKGNVPVKKLRTSDDKEKQLSALLANTNPNLINNHITNANP